MWEAVGGSKRQWEVVSGFERKWNAIGGGERNLEAMGGCERQSESVCGHERQWQPVTLCQVCHFESLYHIDTRQCNRHSNWSQIIFKHRLQHQEYLRHTLDRFITIRLVLTSMPSL